MRARSISEQRTRFQITQLVAAELGTVYNDIFRDQEEQEDPDLGYQALVAEAVARVNYGYRAYVAIEDAIHVVTRTRINSREAATRVIQADG